MLQFNLPNLLTGLLFSTIGALLMVYPYLVWNIWLPWIIGCGLLVTLWVHHDE